MNHDRNGDKKSDRNSDRNSDRTSDRNSDRNSVKIVNPYAYSVTAAVIPHFRTKYSVRGLTDYMNKNHKLK